MGEGRSSEEDVDSVLRASRALMGVVARSLMPALESVTLPQFRVLVVLASSGPVPIGFLASRLGTVASTFSRFVDRLEDASLVEREPNPDSRREILVRLTAKGEEMVREVTERRRHAMAGVLERLTPGERCSLAHALDIFSAAADEPTPEMLLVLGV
jgi:DNA-binding MarR family transcriptional regulator